MRRTKRGVRVVGLLAATVMACGGSDQGPQPSQFNGTWTTPQTFRFPATLVVQNGVVTSFSLVLNAAPQATCTHTITVAPNAAIANSAFSFNVDLDQPQGRFTGPVTGTFSSSTAGTITLGNATSSSYSYRLTCGSTVVSAVGTQAQTGALSRSP